MTARDVAAILEEIHILLELNGGDEFKSRAYSRASRSLETSDVRLDDAAAEGRLASIPGLGKALAAEVAEILQTGTSRQLETLRDETPPGLMNILQIRGLGPKKVRRLHIELGIDSLEGLQQAAETDQIAALSGFGKKSQATILDGIHDLRDRMSKLRLDEATVLAEEILAAVRQLPSVDRAEIAGRLRRGGEEFSSLSFVVQSDDPAAVEAGLASVTLLSDISRTDNLISSQAAGRVPAHIEVTTADTFYATLHQRTGATDYLFMISIPLKNNGYLLDRHGLFKDDKPVVLNSEQELFDLAGIQYIPPELREGIDEVPLALKNEVPTLVGDSDIRGVLHVHSRWSDGANTIEELAEAAHAAGYSYLLMCDHSKAAFYANGLDEDRLAQQGREIDTINERYDPATFRVLKGIECDILADGTMDLADDALATLDAVVASVHSSFSLPIELQTERICMALRNPYVTILGHATGRLVLRREGYAVDLRAVIDTAVEQGKSIELNANPSRLDLSWRMVRYAIRKGVPISINPDAHSVGEFRNIHYGVIAGRKAGLSRDHVLNALELPGFLEKIRSMRTSAVR